MKHGRAGSTWLRRRSIEWAGLFVAALSVVLPSAAQEGDRRGDGPAPVDAFHPRGDQPVTPAFGGSVSVHLPRLPRNVNYMIEGSTYTRWIQWELHEYLVHRDWETWELRPRLAVRWDVEDTVVLAGGRGPGNTNVLFGAVEEDGGHLIVTPLSPGHPLAEPKRIAREDVESVERGTVFTFHLRDDVVWHDGHPFDAADVLFTWRSYHDPGVDCDRVRYKFQKLLHAEMLDEHTIRFFYERQYYGALETFNDFFLLPAHLYDPSDPDHPEYDPGRTVSPAERARAINENPHNTDWVGLGPYRMTSWSQQYVTAERFDGYFDPGNGGYVDEIRWRHLPDDALTIQALLNGEIDFSNRVTSDDYFGAVTSTPAFRRDFYKGYYYVGGFSYVPWNMRRPLFADIRVRKALTHAMDMEEYRRAVAQGLANLPNGPMFYYGPGYDHDVQSLAHDPDRAEELLAEAGWYDRDGDGVIDRDGIPFAFELLVSNANKESLLFAQTLQESLAPLGIRMSVVSLEWATLLERIHQRDFDAAAMGWSLPVPENDPEQLWHSSGAPIGVRGANHAGVADPRVDELIAAGQVELDDEKRWAIWRALHRYLYEEVHPYFYRLATPRKFVASQRLRGIQPFRINPGYSIRRWFLPEGTPGTRPTRERE